MRQINATVSIINNFCDYFKDNFSDTQAKVFAMFTCAMLKDYKRVNLSSLSKELLINYQTLQYFLSDASWNYESLNTARINLLRKQKTTGFSKNGVLAIDDTGSIKPYAKKTEGVSYQYCPAVKHGDYCNVAVFNCFVNAVKHIPLNLKFYKPEAEFICGKNDPAFKSKLDFAMELIEESISSGIPFSHIVFDAWYGSCNMFDFIDQKGKKFICEVKSDRRLFVEHPVSKNTSFIKHGSPIITVNLFLFIRLMLKSRILMFNLKPLLS